MSIARPLKIYGDQAPRQRRVIDPRTSAALDEQSRAWAGDVIPDAGGPRLYVWAKP